MCKIFSGECHKIMACRVGQSHIHHTSHTSHMNLNVTPVTLFNTKNCPLFVTHINQNKEITLLTTKKDYTPCDNVCCAHLLQTKLR